VTADVAAQANLGVKFGELVTQVASGGPAEQAGIKEGDVIQAIDGQSINEQHPFAEVLFTHKPGDVVTATIVRGTKTSKVKVTLGTRPTTSS
jgi:S1-C subfamily serine protease